MPRRLTLNLKPREQHRRPDAPEPAPGQPTRQTDQPIGPAPLEERAVEAADPELTPRTNERLTEELQDVVGASRVEIPADRPHASAGERPPKVSMLSSLSLHWVMVALSLGVVLTIAAIVGLGTGYWWLLPVVAVVHAVGTTVVLMFSISVTRSVEHPSPTVSAAMTAEGVSDPDRRFSEMVEEFRAPEAESPPTWQDDRVTSAREDTATAGVEQARTSAPTSQASEAIPKRGALDAVIIGLAVFLVALAFVVPISGGGNWLWLTPAILTPLSAGLVALHRLAAARADTAARPRPDRTLIVVLGATVGLVAIFCALVVVFVRA